MTPTFLCDVILKMAYRTVHEQFLFSHLLEDELGEAPFNISEFLCVHATHKLYQRCFGIRLYSYTNKTNATYLNVSSLSFDNNTAIDWNNIITV